MKVPVDIDIEFEGQEEKNMRKKKNMTG